MDRTQLLEAIRTRKPAFAVEALTGLSDQALADLLRALEATDAGAIVHVQESAAAAVAEARTAGSLDDQMLRVRQAVRAKYVDQLTDRCEAWAEVIYPDKVIVRKGDRLFSIAYSVDAKGVVTLTGEPVEVQVVYQAVKEATTRAAFEAYEGAVIAPVREGAAEATGATWDVVVVREGLSRNRNLYPRPVLEAAVSKYEGKPVYIDHQEQPRRFGRSMQDLAGFLRNVRPVFMATEALGEPATFAIGATLCVTKPQIRAELLEAWRLGNPGLYGLSHAVDIRGEDCTVGGIRARKVTEIAECASVDLVTTPSAGGHVARVAEAVTTATESRMDLAKLLAQLRALNPQIVESLGATPTEDQVLEALTKALRAAPAATDARPAAPATPTQEAARAAPAAGMVTVAEAELTALRESTQSSARTLSQLQLDRDLSACALPEPVRARIRKRFDARYATGQIATQAEITAAIAEAVEDLGALADAGVVLPHVGMVRAQVVKDRQDKVQEALNDFFDPAKDPRSFRSLYIDVTGDSALRGRLKDATRLTESLNATSFDQALGDSITRRMLAVYASPEFADWKKIATITSLNDFRTQRRIRFGGYGNLPVVNERQAYPQLSSPTDEEATYSPAKRGGTESVTIEMIRNDDVGVIRDIPRRLGRAAAQTLYEFVWDFLRTNAAVYDSVALAAAGHGDNIVTAALTPTQVAILRLAMKNQTDMSNGKRLGLKAKYLIVPNDLEELAFHICTSLKALPDSSLPSTAEPAAPNFLRERVRLEPIVVDYWTDTNNWWLAASPDQTPMLEIGFLDGQQEPQLFVQDMPNVGSMFNNDALTWKIYHPYGGAVTDYRGFAGAIVP